MSETAAVYTVNTYAHRARAAADSLRLRAAEFSTQLDALLNDGSVGVGITADYLATQLANIEAAAALLDRRAANAPLA
jgi:hypothetical protein